jgi:hypothetical protein
LMQISCIRVGGMSATKFPMNLHWLMLWIRPIYTCRNWESQWNFWVFIHSYMHCWLLDIHYRIFSNVSTRILPCTSLTHGWSLVYCYNSLSCWLIIIYFIKIDVLRWMCKMRKPYLGKTFGCEFIIYRRHY